MGLHGYVSELATPKHLNIYQNVPQQSSYFKHCETTPTQPHSIAIPCCQYPHFCQLNQIWLVVSNMFLFSTIYGMSSFPLTFTQNHFSRWLKHVVKPPTRYQLHLNLNFGFNGHSRILKRRYLPYIRPIFRIQKFPLMVGSILIHGRLLQSAPWLQNPPAIVR